MTMGPEGLEELEHPRGVGLVPGHAFARERGDDGAAGMCQSPTGTASASPSAVGATAADVQCPTPGIAVQAAVEHRRPERSGPVEPALASDPRSATPRRNSRPSARRAPSPSCATTSGAGN